MRTKFHLPAILIVIALIATGFFIEAPKTSAQFGDVDNSLGNTTLVNRTRAACEATPGGVYLGTGSAGPCRIPITSGNPNTAYQNDSSIPNRSTATPPGNQIECKDSFTNCIILVVYFIGPGLATWALSISSYFMSIVIQLSLNSTAYALTFLTEGWVIVRDLANMAFIFILIYLALTIMFQADTAGTLKTLAIVVVVALLVNFSFFFTRVIIDTGNIIAVQFYNALPNYGLTGVSGNIKDLGGSLMGAFQAQTLLSNSTFSLVYKATQQSSISTIIVYSVVFLSMAAMMWMMFFAFIQVGIKFMLRIVALWLVLIASPLAFVARTIPKTKTYFSQWLDMLIRFSLYPAVFLFIFFILTKLTTNLVGTGGTGLFGSILNSASPYSAGAILGEQATLSITSVIASVAIRMGFIIALLYIGLKVSEWVVKEGSGMANAVTGTISGAITGTAKKAGGYGFAYTAGALAQRDINTLKKNPPKTRVGQYLDYTWRNKVLKPITQTKVAGVSHEGILAARKERKTDWETNKKVVANENFDKETTVITKNAGVKVAENISKGVAVTEGISDADQRRVANLSTRQMDAMKPEEIKQIAALLTEDQIKRVKAMDALNDKQKNEIEDVWNEHSPLANINKANKAVKEIYSANEKLAADKDEEIQRYTEKGSLINAANLNVVEKNLNDRLSMQKASQDAANIHLAQAIQDARHAGYEDSKIQDSPMVKAVKQQKVAIDAQTKAIVHSLEQLKIAKEHGVKVQANVGGQAAAGEFNRK